MIKEKIFKEYLEDPLITEKKYLTNEEVNDLKFIDQCNVKLIEVIKLAIDGTIDKDIEGIITRKISQFLNQNNRKNDY